MEAREIQYLPPKTLRRHPRNVHVHPKKQIEQLARSIRAFGFTNPILINQRKEVLAGHARLEAAMAAGVELVPTILLDGLSAAEERAYLLADNKLAEKSGWDDASLAVELRELSALLADAGLDLEITGFETAEIDSLLKTSSTPKGTPARKFLRFAAKRSAAEVICGISGITASSAAMLGRILICALLWVATMPTWFSLTHLTT